ncbi:MAG TPA: phosphatidate cytidylyltransferase [Pyrinomonadaceae bacterium]|jgi:phosphatidate cytidylyltransferase|nr:phosphatidate cytidylyltransferase [Pyrinomonadaceae bacterium]
MQRILTAAILLPFLIASILVSWLQLLFVALAAAAMVFALYEFYVLARKREMKPDTGAGYLGAAALFTIFYFAEPGRDIDFSLIQLTLLVLTTGVLIAATLRGAPFDKIIASSGATILGVLYIVLLGGHLVAVRMGFEQKLSAHLLSFFFLVLMGADTGAYYTGRAIGKHKLAPKISPGKTWEGVAGGMLAALALATVSHFWFFHELPLKWALPLAAVMMILGVLGDLAESALKRSAGAKDAAKILPGHGGVLDRLDSLLFNAPLIYYFARAYFGSGRF